ncbi:MAG: hypothetical protein ACXWLH_04080 [Candidatus Saccharimonadales bacterium]
MKKFWLVTILSILSLAIPMLIHQQKVLAACGSFNSPPIYVEDCRNPGYWLAYCGPGNIYKQFGRCANESFYLRREQKIGFLGGNARWIWQYGHDGTRGQADIESANGSSIGDLSGFVNVIRTSLYGTQATWGYNYLVTPGHVCDESPHRDPTGRDLNKFQWCEIDTSALLGASQIINNMLGMGGSNPAFSDRATFYTFCSAATPFSSDHRINGINIAKCRFNEFWSIMNYYDAQPAGSPNGWVDWDVRGAYRAGECRTDSVVYRDVTGYDYATPDYLDTGSYVNCNEDHDNRYIIFHNPGGAEAFRINKFCGNLTGPLRTLRVTGIYSALPNLAAPTLLPDAATPTSVQYNGDAYAIIAAYTPTSAIRVTRQFYYLKFGSITPHDLLSPATVLLSAACKTIGVHSSACLPGGNATRLLPTGASQLVNGDSVCEALTFSPGNGTIDSRGVIIPDSISPNSSQIRCTPVVNIPDKPFLNVYGGDVFAGGGFDNINYSTISGTLNSVGACDNKGKITTFAAASGAGAGTQFAAFAMGAITENVASNQGFSTAQLTSKPLPNYLAFANSVNPFGNYVGKNCITSATLDTSGPNPPSNLHTLDPTKSSYYRSGNLSINDFGQPVPNGGRWIIYVRGNLMIHSNIDFNSASWTSLSDIPYLKFVVQGNIFIDNTVTSISGVYQAQPTPIVGTDAPSGGKIYTCTNGGAPYALSDIINNTSNYYNSCHNQLVINGRFIAENVHWTRTKGDIRGASLSDGVPYVGGTTPNPDAAEVFIEGPESYMAQPPSGITTPSYDSVTNLPPVL